MKLLSLTAWENEATAVTPAVAAMGNRRKQAKDTLLTPQWLPAHRPLNTAVILTLILTLILTRILILTLTLHLSSSSIPILSQTKEGGGNTRQKPSGARGPAAAI